MQPVNNRQRTAWFIATLAVLLCGALLLVALRREEKPAPVIVLNRPFSPPLMLRDRFGRWIPRGSSWAWANRVEDALFGRRKPLKFNQEIFRLDRPGDLGAPQLGLGSPVFSSASAVSVWFPNNTELKALRGRLQRIVIPISDYRSRVSTAEGVGASLFMGESAIVNGSTNRVGLEADYFARVRKEVTDLFTSVQFSELETNDLNETLGTWPVLSVRTNLDFTARLQIPTGCGVFLLSGGGTESKRCVGVIIDPP